MIIPRVAQESLPRREFLALMAAVAAERALSAPGAAGAEGSSPPVTGAADPRLEPFDRLLTSFIAQHHVPGAALAVTRHARLVYARGFGLADAEHQQPVQPESLFRIASVSKPLTAVAVMQLTERGKLQLDDRVLDRIYLTPLLRAGAQFDSRWKQVTVRHCLQHTGGWDRRQSSDPIGRAWEIAEALGVDPPLKPAQIVQYMLGQPLDFDPGQRHAYSNLGYLVLGRVIEAVAGQSYETYVQQEVLAPLGITAPRLGRTLVEHRAADEVRYCDARNRRGRCLYPPRQGQQVPLPDGAEHFEAYEAHGGWIASAVDLVKFAAAFDDPAHCPILDAKTIEEMWRRPEGAAGWEPDGRPKAAFYGCGWSVRPVGQTGKANTWHGGLIAGTSALLVRRWDGLNWAVLFNTDSARTDRSETGAEDWSPLAGQIERRLHEAADQVQKWPGDA